MGQLCTKLDVNRAFKWHCVRPTDAAEFGTRFPGAPVGVPGDVLVVYCVLTFGWTGSPGEFMAFTWVAKWLHATYQPQDPPRERHRGLFL